MDRGGRAGAQLLNAVSAGSAAAKDARNHRIGFDQIAIAVEPGVLRTDIALDHDRLQRHVSDGVLDAVQRMFDDQQPPGASCSVSMRMPSANGAKG